MLLVGKYNGKTYGETLKSLLRNLCCNPNDYFPIGKTKHKSVSRFLDMRSRFHWHTKHIFNHNIFGIQFLEVLPKKVIPKFMKQSLWRNS